MPVGLVSDSELQEELARLGQKDRRALSQSSQSSPVVSVPELGRGEGTVNVPDSLRQIIGEESVINGRAAALEIASSFGVSPSSVSAYAKGATSTKTYDTPSKSIISHINKSRARATKKAGRVLNAALGAITQDKLDYTDARDLSGIAKDMSAIIKNLEPPAESQSSPSSPSSPQFIIYAPQFRTEHSFETVVVNE